MDPRKKSMKRTNQGVSIHYARQPTNFYIASNDANFKVRQNTDYTPWRTYPQLPK